MLNKIIKFIKNMKNWIFGALLGFAFGLLVTIFFLLFFDSKSSFTFAIIYIFVLPPAFVSRWILNCIECFVPLMIFTPPIFYSLIGGVIGGIIDLIKNAKKKTSRRN